MIIESAGDHWLHYGFFTIIKQSVTADGSLKWKLKPWLCLLTQLIELVKSTLALLVQFPSRDYAIYIGDFCYFLMGPASRVVNNIAYVPLAVYPFFLFHQLSKEENADNAIRCLQVFHYFKTGQIEGILAILRPNTYRKLHRFVVYLTEAIYPLHIAGIIYSFILGIGYFINVESWYEFFIGLFWIIHFPLYVVSVTSICAIHTTYFAALCFTVRFAVDDINDELKELNAKLVCPLSEIAWRIDSIKSRASFKRKIRSNCSNRTLTDQLASSSVENSQESSIVEHWRQSVLRTQKRFGIPESNDDSLTEIFFVRGKLCYHGRIRRLLRNLQIALEEMRVCDQHYGGLFRYSLSSLWLASVVLVYVMQFCDLVENIANLVGLLSAASTVCIPYWVAAMVSGRIKRTYKLLNRLMLKPMPVTTKWHYLMTIELLAAKRKRVGFKVKDWFTLNSLNFIKLLFSTMSLFTLFINFGRGMNSK